MLIMCLQSLITGLKQYYKRGCVTDMYIFVYVQSKCLVICHIAFPSVKACATCAMYVLMKPQGKTFTSEEALNYYQQGPIYCKRLVNSLTLDVVVIPLDLLKDINSTQGGRIYYWHYTVICYMCVNYSLAFTEKIHSGAGL